MHRWGTLVLAAVVGIFLGGCAGARRSADPFHTRLYQGTYDEVWLAALKALNDYPLKLSNKDAGKIQSETVNGPYNEIMFVYPEGIELPERFRFTLKMNFARLVADDDSPVIRIRVIKDLERFQDFYTGWTAYPADGLEEKILLYRVEHLLKMERFLNRPSKGDGLPPTSPTAPTAP